jgi:hypothetical protein
MRARGFLLAVPLAVAVASFATLPADAACWVWKPCANGFGSVSAASRRSATWHGTGPGGWRAREVHA